MEILNSLLSKAIFEYPCKHLLHLKNLRIKQSYYNNFDIKKNWVEINTQKTALKNKIFEIILYFELTSLNIHPYSYK